jgi:MSHA pilin protein MshA
MNTKVKGFTLIELVVVITILGILAAFAIPKFTQLDTQARIAAISSLGGSLQSAAALAHAQYLASGTAPATISMEGTSISLSNGWPDATGIQAALQNLTGFTPSVTGTTVTFTEAGGTAAASCAVSYTAASAAGVAGTVSAPVTSGC